MTSFAKSNGIVDRCIFAKHNKCHDIFVYHQYIDHCVIFFVCLFCFIGKSKPKKKTLIKYELNVNNAPHSDYG